MRSLALGALIGFCFHLLMPAVCWFLRRLDMLDLARFIATFF